MDLIASVITLLEHSGVIWVSLAAGLLGFLGGKAFKNIAEWLRSSQMLAKLPQAPKKVCYNAEVWCSGRWRKITLDKHRQASCRCRNSCWGNSLRYCLAAHGR